ncbi:hypothetical protein ACWDU8_27460 [Streptomyces sp. NPDC003388]
MITSFLIPPATAALLVAFSTAVLIRRDRRRWATSADTCDTPSGPSSSGG